MRIKSRNLYESLKLLKIHSWIVFVPFIPMLNLHICLCLNIIWKKRQIFGIKKRIMRAFAIYCLIKNFMIQFIAAQLGYADNIHFHARKKNLFKKKNKFPLFCFCFTFFSSAVVVCLHALRKSRKSYKIWFNCFQEFYPKKKIF